MKVLEQFVQLLLKLQMKYKNRDYDYVLLNDKNMNLKKNKLAPNYSGPYTVESVYKADIKIKHIVTGIVVYKYPNNNNKKKKNKNNKEETTLSQLYLKLISND